MSPDEREDLVESLFWKVIELPSAERESFLDSHCTNLPIEVRQALDERLFASESPARLPGPASGMGALVPRVLGDSDPLIGSRVGSYEIESKVGQGGYGTVYRAVRIDGDGARVVAIKILSRDDDVSKKRFGSEGKVLGETRSSYVAQELGRGETDGGLLYIVMEYIDGGTILEYCDRNGLSIGDRLKMYLNVCSALQYVHRNGYIHRDIKPDNILVAADGTPRLVDFGVAGVANPLIRRREARLTETGQSVGTPEYGSPEQLQGGTPDARSDVYSLGVVLYELLTGHYPYKLPEDGYTPSQFANIVANTSPERPSAVIAKGPCGGSVVDNTKRRTQSDLRRRLRGDLDIIVMKAMHKDPSRRYQSPGSLSKDIDNYLHGRPIDGRPDSVWYRVQKFSARHQQVIVGAIAALVMIAMVALLFAWGERLNVRGDAEADEAAARRRLGEEYEERGLHLRESRSISCGSHMHGVAPSFEYCWVTTERGSLAVYEIGENRVTLLSEFTPKVKPAFGDRFDVQFSRDGRMLSIQNKKEKTLQVCEILDGNLVQGELESNVSGHDLISGGVVRVYERLGSSDSELVVDRAGVELTRHVIEGGVYGVRANSDASLVGVSWTTRDNKTKVSVLGIGAGRHREVRWRWLHEPELYWHPLRDTLVYQVDKGAIDMWDVGNSQSRREFEFDTRVSKTKRQWGMGFSNDGSFLLVRANGELQVFSTSTARKVLTDEYAVWVFGSKSLELAKIDGSEIVIYSLEKS